MAEALLGRVLPLAHGHSTGSSDLRQAQQIFGDVRTCRRIAPETRRYARYQMGLRASFSEATNLPLTDLQIMLEDAIRQENYQEAARLRDVLTQRESDSKSAVEDANARFYSAFKKRDMKAMSEVWGSGEHVQCIHPAAGCISGRDNVLESWRMILRGMPMNINLEDVRVCARDGAAFVTCTEVMDAGDSRGRTVATNVFEKQDGRWVLVHHHGGPAPIFV